MSPPAGVTATVDADGARGLLVLSGDVDISDEQDVLASARSLLKIPTIRRLVLDLAKVTFIDSFGVGIVIKVYVMAQDAGRSAALRNPSEVAAGVLKIAGVEQLFELEP